MFASLVSRLHCSDTFDSSDLWRGTAGGTGTTGAPSASDSPSPLGILGYQVL